MEYKYIYFIFYLFYCKNIIYNIEKKNIFYIFF